MAYHTHNIFDVSASSASSTASSAFPTHFSSSSMTTNNGGGGAGSQPSSLHDTYQQHLFNSTLLAINSMMRYNPPSPSSPQHPPSSTMNPPPSTFHPAHTHLCNTTHTITSILLLLQMTSSLLWLGPSTFIRHKWHGWCGPHKDDEGREEQ